ncbi:FUSC family protein [Leptothrix sp. BB-4]
MTAALPPMTRPMPEGWRERPRLRAVARVVLGHLVLNGVSAALGLLVISTLVHLLAGAFAASVASVGVIVCTPPDQAAPKRGKFWHLLPAALIGWPVFTAVQALHEQPLALTALLMTVTFIAFLAGAWGRRGLPIVVSIMFAAIFSMAVPRHPESHTLLATSLSFGLGAALFLVWATLANALLNGLYRERVLADTLLTLAALVRTQARQFGPPDDTARPPRRPLIGELLRGQSALTDQLQAARDLLLESPRTPRRQQLAALLLQALEMRDHLLACELDLDTLRSRPDVAPSLGQLGERLAGLADVIDDVADALLLGRQPSAWVDPIRPGGPLWTAPVDLLAHSLSNRVGHLGDEVRAMVLLARGDTAPDLTIVRTAWRTFVSPTTWSWQPLVAAWRWDAPPLRHAIRATLAIGTGSLLALVLPWGSHDYWILLTIVVVLRGSLAQTLERRNHRVAGTLLGCVLAAALLWARVPPWALVGVVTLAQAVAHAFAVRRYRVTAVAATVLGLVQAHLLGGGSLAFDLAERIADTLIGAALAWLFSYVLPSWERGQLAALVRRTRKAQARHARLALGLGPWQLAQAVDDQPELAWRLARREAHDSLSALVQATERSLAEPRAVRPPLVALGRMLAHSFQLQAQLTAVKTLLLQRAERLDPVRMQPALQAATERIEAILLAPTAPAAGADDEAPEPWLDDVALTAPPEADLNPWALRRLALAVALAVRLRRDADAVENALPAT